MPSERCQAADDITRGLGQRHHPLDPDPLGAQDVDQQMNCVAVHPSRPHLAATGASAGTVAVWDLRFAARPAHATLPGDAGEVWEVRVWPFEPQKAAMRCVHAMRCSTT